MVWILGVLILGPSMLWYWHAHNLYLNYHNTFGIFSAGYLKFGTIEILMNPDFYEHLAFRIAVYHVSPIVFVLLIYGATILQQNRLSYVFHIWLLGVLIYFLIAARGVFIGHYQYVLPIVPAATPLAALGAVRLVKKLSSGSYGKRKNSEKTIFLLGTAIYCLTITASIVLYFSHAIASESGWQNDRMTGLMVSRVTMPGALIVVVDNQMDELKPETSMTPPNVFYFSDRKGWYQSMAWLSPNRIEELRSLGAKYLVITENSVSIFEKDFSSLRSYLNNHFNKSIASNEGIVFDLGYEHR